MIWLFALVISGVVLSQVTAAGKGLYGLLLVVFFGGGMLVSYVWLGYDFERSAFPMYFSLFTGIVLAAGISMGFYPDLGGYGGFVSEEELDELKDEDGKLY